jgi:hypothetical protein
METADVKKPWYKKWWGIIILILTWWISLPVLSLYYIWLKTNWQKSIKIGATVAIIIIWFAVPMLAPHKNTAVVQDVKNVQQPVVAKQSVSAPTAPTQKISELDSVSKIENAIKTVGDFDVTVWTSDKDMADAKSKPPFQIMVIAYGDQIQSCFDAKSKAFNVMKVIYTNDELKGEVARIAFMGWNQLKASLGSKDATFDWNATGPSNIWNVLQQYKSYQDDTVSLNLRTYGVRYNEDCN